MTDGDDITRRAYRLLAELAERRVFDDAARHELVALGDGAIPALADAIGLDDPLVRRFAVRALAMLASRAALATLLNTAESFADSDADLAAIALRGATSALEPRDAPRVADFLARMARQPDPFVRAATADALAKVRPEDARDALLQLAGDDDTFVAESAAAAFARWSDATDADTGDLDADLERARLLGRLGAPDAATRARAVDVLCGRDDAAELVRPHVGARHTPLRRTMLQAAGWLRADALFDALVALIDDHATDDHDRALALRALRPPADRDDDAYRTFVERFAGSTDAFVRAAAARAALASTRHTTHELVAGLLRDREAWVRSAAAEQIAEHADRAHGAVLPYAIDALEQLASVVLDAESGRAVAALARALQDAAADGAFVDQRAAVALSRFVRSPHADARAAAARAYAALRADDGAAPAASLSEQLASASASDVNAALEHLTTAPLGTVEARLDDLLRLLYRATDDQLVAACAVLARTDGDRARDALRRLAAHPVDAVRDAAAEALAKRDARARAHASAADAQPASEATEPPADTKKPAKNQALPSTNRWGKPW